MIRLITTFLVLMTLISCSVKNVQDQDVKLYELSELQKQKLYTNIDSLPDNLNNVFRVSLSDLDLKKLPEIIFKLKNLQELDISQNEIIELKGIENLKKIQILNIGANKFSSFPIEITELRNLKSLALWWNDIKTFPEEFFKNNVKIEELDMTSMFRFDFNKNLNKLHLFKNLRRLNLGNNQIPYLTTQFSKLENLETFGYIRQNKIDLKDLCLRLSNCKKLKTVHFSVNNIEELPIEILLLKNLETLNLFENKIKILPDDIVKMINLKEICLIDNPIDENKIKVIETKMKQTKIIY